MADWGRIIYNRIKGFQFTLKEEKMKDKRGLRKWVFVLVMAMALFAMPAVQPQSATANQPAMVAQAEAHPAMVHALNALLNARRALQQGAHIFGGHRVKALALTNQAIEEVRAALAYAR